MAWGKITTQIDPKLHEKARLEALKRGTTMRALVEEGLRNILDTPKKEAGEFDAMMHDALDPIVDKFNPQPKKGKKK